MRGGAVVPEYDPKYIYCGYCGNKLVWSEKEKALQYNTTTGERLPSPKAYGCPNYGDNGWQWHYYWWEDYLPYVLTGNFR